MKKILTLLFVVILVNFVSAATVYHFDSFDNEISKEFVGYEGDAIDFVFNGNTHIIQINKIGSEGSDSAYIYVFPYQKEGRAATITKNRYIKVDLDDDNVNDFQINLNYVDNDSNSASLIVTRINNDTLSDNFVEDNKGEYTNFKIGAIIVLMILIFGLSLFYLFSKK